MSDDIQGARPLKPRVVLEDDGVCCGLVALATKLYKAAFVPLPLAEAKAFQHLAGEWEDVRRRWEGGQNGSTLRCRVRFRVAVVAHLVPRDTLSRGQP